MEEVVLNQAISIHIILVAVLHIICILNLLILLTCNFKNVNKYMWYLTPLVFGMLGINIIGGISILAMNQFNINAKVVSMFIANIAIIGLEIFRIKQLRYTRKNPSNSGKYIKISKILYTLYVVTIAIFFVQG